MCSRNNENNPKTFSIASFNERNVNQRGCEVNHNIIYNTFYKLKIIFVMLYSPIYQSELEPKENNTCTSSYFKSISFTLNLFF